MNPNPVTRLLSSSKALVVLAVTALAFGGLFAGRASWEQIESLLKWVLGPWLIAQGTEDAAKALGNARVEVAKVNSVPPPADDQ